MYRLPREDVRAWEFCFFCLFLLGDGLSLIFIPPFLSKLQCSYHSYMFIFLFFFFFTSDS